MMQCHYQLGGLQWPGFSSRRMAQAAWRPTQPLGIGRQAPARSTMLMQEHSDGRYRYRLQAVLGQAAPMLQEGWPLWAVLMSAAAFGQVSSKTRWGQALSTPLISMTAGIVLAASGVLPTDCASFDVVWQYLMPLAAACYLLETDMSQLLSVGGPTLVAFLVGAVTMVMGAVVAWAVLGEHMGVEGGKLIACLCASYVGGSVNFAAVSKAVALPAGLVPAAMAADNIAMALFLAILSAVPGQASGTPDDDAGTSATPNKSAASDPPGTPITAESLALVIGAASVSCWLGKQCAAQAGQPCLALMFTAFLAAGMGSAGQVLAKAAQAPHQQPTLATSGMQADVAGASSVQRTPDQNQAVPVFAGAAQLASVLMSLFFVIIGCSAGSLSSLARVESLMMVLFLIIMVFTHWLLLWLANTLFLKLPLPALILGSNANVGGPATAAAMAASKGWRQLIQPAMLCGSLGYAIGTLAGLMVARTIGLHMQ